MAKKKKLKVEIVLILTKKVELDMSDYRPRCGADLDDLDTDSFEDMELEDAARRQGFIPEVDGWNTDEIQIDDTGFV